MTRCRFVSYWARSSEHLAHLTQAHPPPVGWVEVHEAGTIAIFCADYTHVIPLPNGQGVLIGDVLTREDHPRRILSSADLSNLLQQTPSPEGILRSIWGRYVAFLHDGPTHRVLRDPSGGLPCYIMATDAGVIQASDARLLVSTIGIKPTIDWNGLLHHLVLDNLLSLRTALAGMKEVLPGFIARWAGDEVSMGIGWNPWSSASRTMAGGLEDLADHLRWRIRQSVTALAGRSQNALLTVSGGLDSSIVAACLVPKGSSTLLTLATRRPDGDERDYARALAEYLGSELVEAIFEPATIDLAHSNAMHLPRPVGYSYGQAVDRIVRDTVRARNCDSYFTGNGGDNVFCYLTSASPVVDRWIADGPSLGLAATIRDIQGVTGASVPSIVSHAIKRRLRAARYRWPIDRQFLSAGVGHDAIPDHPWLEPPSGAVPGKAAHIAMLLKAQHSLENAPEDIPMVTPLLSQPVMEVCLSMPSWLWCSGGVNRAIARAAFRNDLPSRIIDRTTKTGPGSFMADLFELNRVEIRDRLLNGALAAAGVLDQPSLEQQLAQPTLRGIGFRRIMTLLDCEAWIQSWL